MTWCLDPRKTALTSPTLTCKSPGRPRLSKRVMTPEETAPVGRDDRCTTTPAATLPITREACVVLQQTIGRRHKATSLMLLDTDRAAHINVSLADDLVSNSWQGETAGTAVIWSPGGLIATFTPNPGYKTTVSFVTNIGSRCDIVSTKQVCKAECQSFAPGLSLPSLSELCAPSV
ncbi:hypothetical protein Bbelb_124820 [Branchiostoma belcheri]|nr:hypothetical protein Bbelb_124820 [Branchiostoma belcheri]